MCGRRAAGVPCVLFYLPLGLEPLDAAKLDGPSIAGDCDTSTTRRASAVVLVLHSSLCTDEAPDGDGSRGLAPLTADVSGVVLATLLSGGAPSHCAAVGAHVAPRAAAP